MTIPILFNLSLPQSAFSKKNAAKMWRMKWNHAPNMPREGIKFALSNFYT